MICGLKGCCSCLEDAGRPDATGHELLLHHIMPAAVILVFVVDHVGGPAAEEAVRGARARQRHGGHQPQAQRSSTNWEGCDAGTDVVTEFV